MILAEPMTLLTDYALAGVTGWMGWRLLLVRQGQSARGLWAVAFCALATAAALGGTYHGFAPQLSASILRRLWTATVLVVGLASCTMVAGSVLATVAGRLRMVLLVLAVVKLAVYSDWMLSHSEFIYVIADSGLAMAAIAVLHGSAFLRTGDVSSRWMLGAVGVSGLAAVVQASGFALHRHFNHNDLYHVIQIAAMVLFYQGAKVLRDHERGSGQHGVAPPRDNPCP